MSDKIKPLKIEEAIDGTQINPFPTEADPTSDFVSIKGIALENSDNTTIEGVSGVMKFKDTEVTSQHTLKDAMERIKYKDTDLTNLVNGYVLTWNNSLSKFELQPAGGVNGGSGVTPPFFFSKSGNASVGTYLRTGEAVTSVTGQIIVGNNNIVKIVASNGNSLGSTTRIQFQKRTAITTFTDIANAYIDIPSSNYKATRTGLSITLGTDEELSCYVQSGSTLSNPVVGIYLVPT